MKPNNNNNHCTPPPLLDPQKIFAFDATGGNGSPIAEWKGHAGEIKSIVCHPTLEIVASVCQNTVVWMS
jgi:hypothetical protein